MIKDYVIKLIENLPEKKDAPLNLDLVLDGGLFNGSYLIGALYFLKELEKRKYIIIERISSSSIGAVAAFLYYIDGLDLMPKLYDTVIKDFKQTYNLNIIKELKTQLGDNIPEDICERVNNKFFISYNNVNKRTKIVKSTYKDVDDIINIIIKSSYIPFLIDGNILYENKYIDGGAPYIFKREPNKKILYLDLFGYDKIGNTIIIKNEKNNLHRILHGLLDIHSFFIKKSNTSMCSFVNDWNVYNKGGNCIKIWIEKICVFLIYLISKIDHLKETVLYKILSKILHSIFIIILENYCF